MKHPVKSLQTAGAVHNKMISISLINHVLTYVHVVQTVLPRFAFVLKVSRKDSVIRQFKKIVGETLKMLYSGIHGEPCEQLEIILTSL